MSRVGITGASGYVGSALLARLRADGHAVVAIGRRHVAGAEAQRAADLRAPVAPDLLDGLDAVVHAAADTGAGTVTPAEEIAFAQGLLAQAARAGCRVVFVSSQGADAGGPSAYGRTKAAIEAHVLAAGGRVVRPGLVYGGAAAGLYGTLVGLVRRLPVLPALRWPTPRVWPLHVDDLAAALAHLAVAPGDAPAAVCLGGPPLPFDRFLAAIARQRLGKRVVFVPVPVGVVRALLATLARVLGPRLSPARLDALVRAPAFADDDGLARLGIAPRTFAQGLHAGVAARRALLREGARLARALLGVRAPPSLLRRYARALPRLGVAQALDLSPWLGPALLAALDTHARRGANARAGDLAWRFGVVARLAEAEPALAPRFLHREGAFGAARAVVALALAAWLELRGRMLAPLAARGLPDA